MENFDIHMDLWTYKDKGEFIGKFNESVLTDSTIMAIMDDMEKHLKENEDENLE